MPNNIWFYPYNTPIILTDDLFIAAGGQVGSSSPTQRANSYTIAEERVSAHLQTFLTPTVVTGTFMPNTNILVGHSYVRELYSVRVWNRDGNSSCSMSVNSACAYLKNALYGIIEVNYWGGCGCGGIYLAPYQVEASYKAGIASGTSYHPSLVQALKIEAQIELNEMGVASINEGVGDVGVQSFSNQEYSERRVALKSTALGTSAVSNHAERLLRRFLVRRGGGL